MTWMRIFVMVLVGLILLATICLGFFYYAAKKSAQTKSIMLDDLAKTPVGSTPGEVMRYAEKLGFNFESNEFAIPNAVEMTNNDVAQSPNSLPEKVTKSTDLSKLKNGSLKFGLSLFLFSRKGCEITFKDGAATGARVWWLD